MAEDFEVNGPLPEESENRTFVLAAAGLGALLVLSMICLGLYALVIAPSQRENRNERATQIVLENTQQARSFTETALAQGITPSVTASLTPTQAPSPTTTVTQVVVLPSDTPTVAISFATVDPQTATAIAQQTLVAGGGGGTATPTPTALPAAGFADEVGLPGLVVMGAVLLVVVFVSRRLRMGSLTG